MAVLGAAAARTRHPPFIGGKSMGGRIATQIAARSDTPPVAGIVVLGYPLHPPGKPDTLRVQHLSAIRVPVLILQGTRDPFGSPDELAPYFTAPRATIHPVRGGDHSFKVPKTAGPQPTIHLAIVDAIVGWIDRTRGVHA
jgi:predicted alpha/beta-hydrolase family hydrolase